MECIGELREDFFIEMLKMKSFEFYYLYNFHFEIL